MRYLGFGIGHVDPAVRARPEFRPSDVVSVLDALQDTELDDETDITNVADVDITPEASDAEDNSEPEDDFDDEPLPEFIVEPTADL